jgi:hypothetical protein
MNQYHEQNTKILFRYLPELCRFPRILCYGSAYGHELRSILHLVEATDIIEPLEKFGGSKPRRRPASLYKAKHLKRGTVRRRLVRPYHRFISAPSCP